MHVIEQIYNYWFNFR